MKAIDILFGLIFLFGALCCCVGAFYHLTYSKGSDLYLFGGAICLMFVASILIVAGIYLILKGAHP